MSVLVQDSGGAWETFDAGTSFMVDDGDGLVVMGPLAAPIAVYARGWWQQARMGPQKEVE